MKGKNPIAQELTITLLSELTPAERIAVWKNARRDLDGDTPAVEQLDLCVMMAGESRISGFSALAKSIVARQTNQNSKKITKLDLYVRMKNGEIKPSSANNTVDRIHDGVRKLKEEEIEALCSGFADESNRLFWKNEIYIQFPDLQARDVEGGPVMDCLQATWNNLTSDQRELARIKNPQYAKWFQELDGEAPEEDAHRESPQTGLYAYLEDTGMSQEKIAEELGMDKDTLGNYKRAWERFEANNCEGRFPRNRLSRERLLYLAVRMDMSFERTVCMLAKAGYGFRDSDMDRIVAGYLLGLGGEYTKEQALNKLHPKAK